MLLTLLASKSIPRPSTLHCSFFSFSIASTRVDMAVSFTSWALATFSCKHSRSTEMTKREHRWSLKAWTVTACVQHFTEYNKNKWMTVQDKKNNSGNKCSHMSCTYNPPFPTMLKWMFRLLLKKKTLELFSVCLNKTFNSVVSSLPRSVYQRKLQLVAQIS